MSEETAVKMDATVIVLLGAPNEPDGALSSIARERCEQALREHRRDPEALILPTGGFGEHFNTSPRPHGYYTARYLREAGVPAELLLPVAESSNTIEDAEMARPILERARARRVILVTSDFHGARAKLCFQRVLPEMEIALSCAKTNLPEDELERLRAHETRALARLLQSPT